jgi:uncharacterized membrane protein YfcA
VTSLFVILTVLWAGFTVVFYPIFMRVVIQHSQYLQGGTASPFFVLAIFVLIRYLTNPAWELLLVAACIGAIIGALIGQWMFDKYQVKSDNEENGPGDDHDTTEDPFEQDTRPIEIFRNGG